MNVLRFILALSLPLMARGQVVFTRDIAPLIHSRCAACHHNGGDAPFPLLTAADARKRVRQIVEVTAAGDMPPWLPMGMEGQFAHERRLTAAEKKLLNQWLVDGAPEGDPALLPAIPEFSHDWQGGAPDLVVEMSTPFLIPADGPAIYRNFVIPLPQGADQYVAAVEVRPSSRAVHHAFVRAEKASNAVAADAADAAPGFAGMASFGPGTLPAADAFAPPAARREAYLRLLPEGRKSPPEMLPGTAAALGAWVPGYKVPPLPADTAHRLPGGSHLVLSLRMVPIAKPQRERTRIGLHFAKQPPAREVIAVPLNTFRIVLPAGSRVEEARAKFVTPVPLSLLSLWPHAHQLATMLEVIAHVPGTESRRLLDIREWNFDQQQPYSFREPQHFPAGTRFELCVRYDNSSTNPANPTVPARTVRFGESPSDEMALVILQTTLPNPADRPSLDLALAASRDRMFSGLLTGLLEGPPSPPR